MTEFNNTAQPCYKCGKPDSMLSWDDSSDKTLARCAPCDVQERYGGKPWWKTLIEKADNIVKARKILKDALND